MADCKNKFLGLDSIDFLKNYIDDKFQKETIATSVITLQVFKYFDNSVVYREKPADNIYYDFETGSLKNLSNEWGTLKDVTSQLTPDGAIYLSTRIQQGTNGEDISFTEWSEPIKISGENGATGRDGIDGINFAFSFDEYFDEYDFDVVAPELTEESGPIYYWMFRNDLPVNGTRGAIWAKYTTDGKDGKDGLNAIYYEHQYAITSVDDVAEDDSLVPPSNDAIWYNNVLPTNLTKKFPYLWKRSRKVTIDGTETWSEPALISRFGQDGTAPEYNMTLYKWSEGYLKPDQPTIGEFNEETGKYEFIKLDDFRANNPDWLDVPTLDVAAPVIDVENTLEVSTVKDITDNLVDGKIIKLSEDIQIPTPIIITEGNVTIDLNGHTITAGNFMESNGEVLEGDTDSYVFWVKGGHLTIQGNGKVIASPAKYSMAVWSNGGDVTIKGGRYENGGESCDLIYGSARTVDGVRQGGTIKIYGGEFYATLIGEEAGTGNKRSALNTKNADMDICFIEVYGGYFHEFDPSNNLSLPGSTGNFLGEGVKLVNNNGVFEVVNKLIPNIWWQCTVKINGGKEEVMQIGAVERYTAIDGAALPGEFTRFKYKWFDAQTLPEDFTFNAEDWNDTPDLQISISPEASLWMTSSVVNGIDSNGALNFGPWTSPVKISGPRGPISYDYRVVTLYKLGNASAPTGKEWLPTIPTPTKNNPHIWARPHLVCYYMKYDDNNDIVSDDSKEPKVLDQDFGQFRISPIDGVDGKDGKNGNSSNIVVYTSSDSTITINEYFGANYYIASTGNITYDFKLNILAFEPGATFKFSNSKANLTFKTEDTMPFLVNGIETTEFNTSNYDCFEIVCVQADKKLLIVIGGKFENYSQN